MKAKRLIEVAMPIKEISAESQRDKAIRQGHVSTLHLWWARRPLPACRAIVFGSLVPDPLDASCPRAFLDAVDNLLMGDSRYKPYPDIPYTAVYDPMIDNRRNRLLMFIGKFSDDCQRKMLSGSISAPADQISCSSLIKYESRNSKEIIDLAQKLIWIAFNSETDSSLSYEALSSSFYASKQRIEKAERDLYTIENRHLRTEIVLDAENELRKAIEEFQLKMPIVFDPFAGGGAIPLEAARLGCRSFGNDINPVAHIIEKGTADLPQKYGKPIIYSRDEYLNIYGEDGLRQISENTNSIFNRKQIEIKNRLAFDVEYYAKHIIAKTFSQVGRLYPKDQYGNNAIAYYWARTAKCSNPSCGATIPLLRGFYLCYTAKKHIYLKPSISGDKISFSIQEGNTSAKGWNNRGVMTCPCCGSITDIEEVKRQSLNGELEPKLIAVIGESDKGKTYSIPTEECDKVLSEKPKVQYRPNEMMTRNSNGGDTFPWGYTKWGDLFTERQLYTINHFVDNFNDLKAILSTSEYGIAVLTFLAIWLDRIFVANTSFGLYNTHRETIERIMGRQAISMTFDFPESNPFCESSGSAINQLDWIIKYLEAESNSPFSAVFSNASSGDKQQFNKKSISAVVTDPPYYDAIAYADCSDFFYVWLKKTLGDLYPLNFTTPQTPKTEECTALKYHHNGDDNAAKIHFENKLTSIFDAIEIQTSDIVSIMFAHQSTEAWTTLCNSILGARMNITGSWAMDTEMSAGLKTDKGYLESSVTVACRPSERNGFGDYKDVKESIKSKVTKEVDKLYSLGFRGADLLTACFGQAVSEFGKYKVVEKADGSEVTVAELLDMASTTAFNALLKGVQGDDFTRFYIGWLQMNGTGETDFDDATKFTRVGMQVDISEIFAHKLLIKNGSKQHLASAEEHLGDSRMTGTRTDDSLIDQAHRAMLSYESGNRELLLKLLHDIGADDINAPFWRLLASLKELLPDGSKDLKNVEGLLGNSDNLRQEAKKADQPVSQQLTFDF